MNRVAAWKASRASCHPVWFSSASALIRLAFSFVLVLPGTGAAATFAIGELMQMLASVESANARFVETRESALLKAPLVLQGTLAYRRPDRVEKHVQSPYDERITVEGGRLTLENRTHNRKKSVPVSGAPGLAALVESMRATRAGDLAALQRHYALQLEGTRERWTLRLRPLDAQVAGYLTSITLSGSGTRIGRIAVEEAGGDRSTMEIEEQGPERAGDRAPPGKDTRGPPDPPAPPGAR